MTLRPESALLALTDVPRQTPSEVATRFAELPKLNLVGRFALTTRYAAPGRAEFKIYYRTWRLIDLDRMVHEQMLAAQTAHRVFRSLQVR
jgi:hypothetical protein